MDALNLYILTFNCARNLVDVDRFAHHFFDSLPLTDESSTTSSFPPPDLIVLSLQELAPIAYAFLGGSFLTPYFDALSQVVNRAVAQRWDDVHYVNIVTDNSGMTGLMVFARSDVAEQVAGLETARIGFGFQEMGNKGAVGARLGYLPSSRQPENNHTGTEAPPPPQPVELTFVAAHLAPMEWAVERRNADWRSLVERLVFERQDGSGGTEADEGGLEESAPLLSRDSTTAAPVGQQQQQQTNRRGVYVPTSYLFLAGDLNYRTADRPPRPGDRASRFPRVNVETSDPRHYSHLLQEDQLSREMGESRCFHGLSEAPIRFPPTYKYSLAARHAVSKATAAAGDEGLSQEWQWTGTRWPSWCDRVLYLDQPDQPVRPLRYDALPLFATSDHRAVALTVSVPARPMRQTDALAQAQLPAAPFPIDPEWARRRDAARRKELVVGCVAYLGLTWEGNGVLLATVVGLCGAWLVLRSLVNA
ncbi:putative inositol 5-phosphatase [Aspergillus saccharolyticus JOP 1030-1]|uniref:Putative inositol 5-phosphatase n=1 Tax=Aspergillus saccharolyticus JOP 1030-1 TaxID=1450539 RepID=A0A318Z3V8_9EURO|nr:putative inositol 5-phosphatase [Aspergillus saccharolyticus JOP 1030-1]PYH41756.1 putative inositol 5-phosphatase [Aspergillus saccharolyticus JOP 1030-1]